MNDTLTPEEAAAITADTLRLNDRYVREIVEGFNVCPFARGGRVAGRTDRVVMLQADLDVAPTLAEMDRYERGSDAIEIVQMIYPRVTAGPVEFDEFVARVCARRGPRRGRSRPSRSRAFTLISRPISRTPTRSWCSFARRRTR